MLKSLYQYKSYVKYNIKKATEFLIKESKVKTENFVLCKSSKHDFYIIKKQDNLTKMFYFTTALSTLTWSRYTAINYIT